MRASTYFDSAKILSDHTKSEKMWSRLIKFVDESNITSFGDACIDDANELTSRLSQKTLHADRLEGDNPFALKATGERVRVIRLLPVLCREDIPIVKCIGLNYMKHSMQLIRA